MKNYYEPKTLVHISERTRLERMIMEYERMNLSASVKDEFIKLLINELEQYKHHTAYIYHLQQLNHNDGKYDFVFHKEHVDKYHKYLEYIKSKGLNNP